MTARAGVLARLRAELSARGVETEASRSARSFRDGQPGWRPDVVLLDLIHHAREQDKLMREVRGSPRARGATVMALCREEQAGALELAPEVGDFITLQTPPGEAAARLRLGAARARSAQVEPVLRFGPLALDPARRRLRVGEREEVLTLREFGLARFLMIHPGRVWSREALLRAAWGSDYEGGVRTVDIHIRRLRAKLGPAYAGLIETVQGVGYCLAGGRSPVVGGR